MGEGSDVQEKQPQQQPQREQPKHQGEQQPKRSEIHKQERVVSGLRKQLREDRNLTHRQRNELQKKLFKAGGDLSKLEQAKEHAIASAQEKQAQQLSKWEEGQQSASQEIFQQQKVVDGLRKQLEEVRSPTDVQKDASSSDVQDNGETKANEANKQEQKEKPDKSVQFSEQQRGQLVKSEEGNWNSDPTINQFQASLQKSLANSAKANEANNQEQKGKQDKSAKTLEQQFGKQGIQPLLNRPSLKDSLGTKLSLEKNKNLPTDKVLSKPQVDSPGQPELRLEQPKDNVVNPGQTNTFSSNAQDKVATKANEANKKDPLKKTLAPDQAVQEQAKANKPLESKQQDGPDQLLEKSKKVRGAQSSPDRGTEEPKPLSLGLPEGDWLAFMEKYRAENGSGYDLEGMAKGLQEHLQQFPSDYQFVRQVIGWIGPRWEDNLAAEFVDQFTLSQLVELSRDYHGRAMMDQLYDAMITGDVSDFERHQTDDRLLWAKQHTYKDRISQEEFLKTLDNGLMIFPIRSIDMWHDSETTFTAELLPNGKVQVRYTSINVEGVDDYKEDRETLRPPGESVTERDFILDPEQVVAVRLYDQGSNSKPIAISALQLIDYSNQLKEKKIQYTKFAVALGLTLGTGALAGTAIAEARAAIAVADTPEAVLAATRALHIARASIWANRVQFGLQAGSLVINEHRKWIEENVPGGHGLLKALDVANLVAEAYGWAHLTVGTLRSLRSKLEPEINSWRAETAKRTDFSSTDQIKARRIGLEAESFLDELIEGQEQAASKAANKGATSAGEPLDGKGAPKKQSPNTTNKDTKPEQAPLDRVTTSNKQASVKGKQRTGDPVAQVAAKTASEVANVADEGLTFIEIGAGDLKASIEIAKKGGAKVIAVDPTVPGAAAVRELEVRGGKFVKGVAADVAPGTADHVFQYFPYQIGGRGSTAIRGTTGTWSGTWSLIDDTVRLLKPKGAAHFVTEHYETAKYLAGESTRHGLRAVITETTAGAAAIGASGAGVPGFSKGLKVWMVNIYK